MVEPTVIDEKEWVESLKEGMLSIPEDKRLWHVINSLKGHLTSLKAFTQMLKWQYNDFFVHPDGWAHIKHKCAKQEAYLTQIVERLLKMLKIELDPTRVWDEMVMW